MGNTLGGRNTAKIMKIDGETIKFKTPIQVGEVVKDFPGHVLLDSQTVKQFGIRAKPLDHSYNLESRKLYFLVELPKFQDHEHHRVPRRVRSAIHVSAKDRLESLMLSRRSVSDLSMMGSNTRVVVVDGPHDGDSLVGSGSSIRVKMRLPKAEVERLMSQSRDHHDMASKIVDLCEGKTGQDPTGNGTNYSVNNGKVNENIAFANSNGLLNRPSRLGNPNASRARPGYKKRVGFVPISEGDVGVAVA